MKRSPLKRGTKPLERRTPLSPGDKPLERKTPLKQGDKPLARGGKLKVNPKPKRTADEAKMSAAWRIDVLAAAGGRCVVCRSGQHVKGHHVITQQKLREVAAGRSIPPAYLLWDRRVGMALCEDCHVAHHAAVRRVPQRFLSESNIAFASDLGLDWYLERTYS